MKIPLLASLLCCLAFSAAFAEVRVPGFTAYLEPSEKGVRISEQAGVSGWAEAGSSVVWGGEIKAPGDLTCAVALRPPAGAAPKLKLTVGAESHEAAVKPAADGQAVADFGTFHLKPGWTRFVLQSLNGTKPAGDIDALVLNGPAAEGAHFNTLPRRNAASIHLNYTLPKGAELDAFYCEATAVEDPIHTFYMVCGFQRGYFGMQVNGPNERRIIFSVWDSGAGKNAAKRDSVDPADQVAVLAKGDGVVASAFGNEGTGGHSHLIYPWKTGERQRFLLTSKPAENESAIFSGYYFHPEKKQWMLIASFRAPKATPALGHFHSFSENFVGTNGQLRRKVRFGNEWVHVRGGNWKEVLEGSFSHDETGKTARLDREMGVENGAFYLAHGGFTGTTTKYGDRFTRPATATPPAIDLTKLP